MRGAYTLLGIAFLILIVGAMVLFSKSAEAPESISDTETVITDQEQQDIAMIDNKFTLTSGVFTEGEEIPALYTCDGENTNPPLVIEHVPDGTISLALLVDDPDIPDAVKEARGIEKFDHWVVYNIDPGITEIKANEQFTEEDSFFAHVGLNSRGDQRYTGPCPPREYEPTQHRYFFRLYALDKALDLEPGASMADVESALEGHVIAMTTLIGVYERPPETES